VLDLLDAELPVPVRGVFTTRAGGVSLPPYDGLDLALHTGDEWDRVHANRDLAARALGMTYRDLVTCQQVHGVRVRLVEGPNRQAWDRGLPGTDALVTRRRGVALTILGADCLPVLLADPDAGVVGAAHVGRAGLVGGILHETLRVMTEQGAEPTRTRATLGPGACGRCYEVPEKMANDVERLAPGSRSTTSWGTPALDLTAGARAQLLAAGLADVSVVGGCTIEQPERFYSYRRDGLTGRHGGLVWLP